MKRSLVAIAVTSLALTTLSCKNAETNLAGQAYKDSLNEMKASLDDFHGKYEKVEAEIDRHREGDRAEVVETIEKEMLPMLDRTIAAFEDGIPKGRNYVGKLDDSVSAKPKIAAQLDTFETQLAGFEVVRKTYATEASLFSEPSHEPDELQKVFQLRLEASRKIAGQ